MVPQTFRMRRAFRVILNIAMGIAISLPALPQAPTSLGIGDTVPEMTISNVLNYSKSSIEFSELKGKLLILDFWATWCGPCISAFPKLDNLQNKFRDKLQILSVTTEKDKVVGDFLLSMKKVKGISPVTVVGDSQLKKLFVHVYLPHYVWIDQAGKIVAITDDKAVTEENINKLLSSGSISMEEKRDEILTVVTESESGNAIFHPAIKIKSGDKVQLTAIPKSNLVFKSVLTHYTEGMAPGAYQDSTTISMYNTSIFSLFRSALWKFQLEMLNANNTVVDVKDTSLLNIIRNKNSVASAENPSAGNRKISEKNRYCYELKVPGDLKSQKFDIMLNELNNYFGATLGIEGVFEDRKASYLALVRMASATADLKTKGGAQVLEKNKFSFQVKNVSVEAFIQSLLLDLQAYPPIFDETGIEENIDLDLNCHMSNLDALNAELKKYGLQLIEKQKLSRIAVIRQKRKSS